MKIMAEFLQKYYFFQYFILIIDNSYYMIINIFIIFIFKEHK